MKASQWTGLGILALALPAFGLVAWFVVFHFFMMAPHSRDPDYTAAYWIETELYYGSDCGRVMSELKANGVVEPGLIECRRDPHFGFVNTKNGTFLHVRRHFSLQTRWLPSGEKVIVDENNGYVFWAQDGKVTNFVKLDSKLDAQLLRSPPEPAEGVSVPGKDKNQDGDKKSVQHDENGGESVTAAHARDDDAGTAHTPRAKPR